MQEIRLECEQLPQMILPTTTTYVWNGDGDGSSWDDGDNWDKNTSPNGTSHIADLTPGADTLYVYLDEAITLHQLKVGDSNIEFRETTLGENNAKITLVGDAWSTVDSGGWIKNWTDSTAKLVLDGGDLRFNGGSTFDGGAGSGDEGFIEIKNASSTLEINSDTTSDVHFYADVTMSAGAIVFKGDNDWDFTDASDDFNLSGGEFSWEGNGDLTDSTNAFGGFAVTLSSTASASVSGGTGANDATSNFQWVMNATTNILAIEDSSYFKIDYSHVSNPGLDVNEGTVTIGDAAELDVTSDISMEGYSIFQVSHGADGDVSTVWADMVFKDDATLDMHEAIELYTKLVVFDVTFNDRSSFAADVNTNDATGECDWIDSSGAVLGYEVFADDTNLDLYYDDPAGEDDFTFLIVDATDDAAFFVNDDANELQIVDGAPDHDLNVTVTI